MAHKEAKDAQLTLLIYSKLGLSNILLINFNPMLKTTAINSNQDAGLVNVVPGTKI